VALAILCLIAVSAYRPAYGQVTISGQITDRADSQPLEQVPVVVYRFNTNQIITYTFSNDQGHYRLSNIPVGVFTLKATMLGYHPYLKELVIADSDSVHLPLSFSMEQKATELSQVVVQAVQPIIIKKDTIIFNVAHWTQATDRTLEEVLARIPGFKIHGDGELSVNGKRIDKVIINGREVSDAGAALITRSIAPENVKEIEVRLDEKDAALKESLIDTRRLVVLDIKLKDEVNQSLFGLARGNVGQQQKTRPGVYGNGFSLRNKTNIHVFAEHDQFGEETIALDQIKNIGEEAFQKIFNVPADFGELTERQEFNKEIYGFKDYTRSINSVVGTTVQRQLAKNLKLFAGSYNAHQILERQRTYEQIFFGNPAIGFNETNTLDNLSSKNKIEIRFDTEKWKVRTDANAVFLTHRVNNVNDGFTSTSYAFNHRHTASNFYQNAFAEYVPKGSWAFRAKSAFASRQVAHTRTLDHNDTTYGRLFFNALRQPVFSMRQTINDRLISWYNEAGAFFKRSRMQTSIQFRHEIQRLEHEKRATDQSAEGPEAEVGAFSLPNTFRQFQKFGPGLRQAFQFDPFRVSGEVFYTTAIFPLQNGSLQNLQQAEYNVSLDLNANHGNHVMISWMRRISAFSLHKVLAGYTLRDFQNVSVIGAVNVAPQPEEVWQVWAGKNFQSIQLIIDPAFAFGRTLTSDRIVPGGRLPVETFYDQLPASYFMASVPFTKNFNRIPIQLVLEPELVNSSQQNIGLNAQTYLTKTERYLLGLKVNSAFEKKVFTFFLYPKYSAFRFSTDIDPTVTTMQMSSLTGSAGVVIAKNVAVNSELRHVIFRGPSDGTFTNARVQIRYTQKSKVFWLEADNLLNNRLFIRQSILPNVFIDNQEVVFGRYLKIGLDFKFR
jgi:hypothetical protein